MSIPRTAPVVTALAALALAAGCGGSSGSSTAERDVANLTARAQFASFADVVNLRATDLEGFVAEKKKRHKRSAALESSRIDRCTGITKKIKPTFKRGSETFTRQGSLQYQSVSSEVEVAPSVTTAARELAAIKRALASAAARRCLAAAFGAGFAAGAGGGRATNVNGVRVSTSVGPMALTPLAPGAVVGGTDGGVGMSIGATVQYTFTGPARTLTVPAALRIDVFGFDVGRAGVSLLTAAVGNPIPAQLEAHLLSTLVSRARSASRVYPAVHS